MRYLTYKFNVLLSLWLSLVIVNERAHAQTAIELTETEKAVITGFSLQTLPAPTDPSNAYITNAEAAQLGKKLFAETRFSANGMVACASCHQEQYEFTDPAPRSSGLYLTRRHAMTLVGAVYSPWQFWDGRADSLWAQALEPLESAEEHGTDRTQVAKVIARHYRADYESLFGSLPDLAALPDRAGPVRNESAHAAWNAMSEEDKHSINTIYANVGKAIAAFEATLLPKPNRVDDLAAYIATTDNLSGYRTAVARDRQLNDDELQGLKLFVGKAQCSRCHFGPLYSNFEFFNTGVPLADNLPFDAGRIAGAQKVARSEFNCLSRYSDAETEQCDELSYLRQNGEELIRAFKVGSLRNVAVRPPYMHNGIFFSLSEVLRHYNSAPQPDVAVGHTELTPLKLTPGELQQLESFLNALTAP